VLAAGGDDASVRFFEYAREGARYDRDHFAETAAVSALAWHPAGTHLFVGTRHVAPRLWDVTTRTAFTSPTLLRGDGAAAHHAGGITDVACPVAGVTAPQLATAADTVRLWDPACLELSSQLTLSAPAVGVDWSGDGRYLLVTTQDGAISLFDSRRTSAPVFETRIPPPSTFGALPRQTPTAARFTLSDSAFVAPNVYSGGLFVQAFSSGVQAPIRFPSPHPSAPVTAVAAARTAPAFLSCQGETVQFWFPSLERAGF
jgi:WD40 repeat protein